MTAKHNRPIDDGDWNMAYLFPQEVAEARDRIGLIILPVAPIEWHGPHMAMGTDNLLAHAFARRLAAALRCPYYPPLPIGTERERDEAMLKSMGFRGDEHIEGMDWPANSVASAYYREEVFALVLRDTLNILFNAMRFPKVLIVNGHGAANQSATLTRLCNEFNGNAPDDTRVMWVYSCFPESLRAGSIAHAGAEESSLLEATWPGCVDLSQLPATGRLKNLDFAIIDGETFDCSPTKDYTVREKQDPRKHTDPEWGERLIAEATREVIAQVKRVLLREEGQEE
jgi:creatinine amidohydrolase